MVISSARDKENNRCNKKVTKNKDRTEKMVGASYSERVRAKWFCCALKLGFLKLICKTFSIF